MYQTKEIFQIKNKKKMKVLQISRYFNVFYNVFLIPNQPNSPYTCPTLKNIA